MKKIISVLLCFSLLLTFTAFAAAETPEPEVLPEIYFYGDPPAVQLGYDNNALYGFGGMLLRGEIRNCANLENCKIAVRYDPWVLEFTEEFPDNTEISLPDGFLFFTTEPKWIERNVCEMTIEICRIDDRPIVNLSKNESLQSTLQTTESAEVAEIATDSVLQLFPLQFIVRNPGATCLSIEILSWTTTDGNTVDGSVTLTDGIINAMSKEDYIAMTTIPECLTGLTQRYSWTAPEGLTAAQLKEAAPDTADAIIMNVEQTRELADDETIGTGCWYKICKNGETYFSKQLVVKNDLNGDSFVTSEDARLALRFAVDLDTASDAQHYAVGLATYDKFTSALARSILRYSIGLEP